MIALVTPALAGLLVVAGAVMLGFLPGPLLALRRETTGRGRALLLSRALRTGIVGLALVGMGAGILDGVGWLVGLCAIIGGEELLETTTVITALRDGERQFGLRRAPRARLTLPMHLRDVR